MTSIDHNDDTPAQRLARMQHEFLAAQQRRRERPSTRAAHPDDTNDRLGDVDKAIAVVQQKTVP